ncbi:MAG TPA: LysM peptidoglycan-binding domain-containing protein [Anaerolineales bacterium]
MKLVTTKKASSILHIAVSAMFALALLAAALPQTAQAASACAKNYTVVAGDNLSGIAFANNTTVLDLANANNLKDPYVLTIGQTLCIPGSASTNNTSNTSSTSSSASSSSSTSAITTTNTSAPVLIVTRTTQGFTLQAKNFAAKSSYIVKVGEGRYGITDWIRLSRLRTTKDGTYEKSYRLDREMRAVSVLTVCVKNATSDQTLCRTVR